MGREVDAWCRWARASSSQMRRCSCGGTGCWTGAPRRWVRAVPGDRPMLVDWLASLQVAGAEVGAGVGADVLLVSAARETHRRRPTVRCAGEVPPTQPQPAPASVLPHRGTSTTGRAVDPAGGVRGLRRAEIAQLHTRDVTGEELRSRGRVSGCGRAAAPGPRGEARAGAGGFVFTSPRVAPDSGPVEQLMSAALGDGWSAHTLRHRFATRLYDPVSMTCWRCSSSLVTRRRRRRSGTRWWRRRVWRPRCRSVTRGQAVGAGHAASARERPGRCSPSPVAAAALDKHLVTQPGLGDVGGVGADRLVGAGTPVAAAMASSWWFRRRTVGESGRWHGSPYAGCRGKW